MLGLAIGMVATAACEKNAARTTWDEVGRPAVAVAANRATAAELRALPLLAHVPADTPFVFAAFEPLPRGYLERVCHELCPVLAEGLGRAGSSPPPPGWNISHQTVIADVLAALAGTGDIGLEASPRWVLYGLGALPVLRLEVRDPVALGAAIVRAGGRGATLQQQGAQRYWHHRSLDRSIVAGIIGRELVVSYGTSEAIALALPTLFGGHVLGPSMADGQALRDVAATHGFAGYGVGFLDTGRLLELRAEEGLAGEITRAQGREATAGWTFFDPAAADPPEPAPPTPSPAAVRQTPCHVALARGAAVFPRVVFGFDELVAKRLAFTVMLEAEPGLAARLPRAAVSWPSVSTRVANRPLAVLGGAADPALIAPLLADLRAWVGGTSAACEPWWWLAALAPAVALDPGEVPGLGEAFSQAGVFGAVAVVQSSRVRGGLPHATEGYVVLGTSRPGPVLAAMQRGLPGTDGPAWLADGSYRTLSIGSRAASMLDAPIEVGGGGERVVLSAGSGMRTRAEASSAGSAIPSPLVLLVVELGKVQRLIESWLSIAAAFGGTAGNSRLLLELSRAQQRLFSLAAASLHATSAGLAVVIRLDLR
ncbi:MAG TPA: hypothetical protein VML75_21580 [Kofleriaceae bacterium]|nr:hypothetical protein [Kofleriaceae bacterium]